MIVLHIRLNIRRALDSTLLLMMSLSSRIVRLHSLIMAVVSCGLNIDVTIECMLATLLRCLRLSQVWDMAIGLSFWNRN